MTAHAADIRSVILPRKGPAAGVPLWGEARRKQPVLPLIALSLVTLLIAAPAAMSGQGESANPIVLMHSVAKTTYQLAGLQDDANHTLYRINQNVAPLSTMQANMVDIAAAADGMDKKTQQLNAKLAGVGTSVTGERKALEGVDAKLAVTAGSLGGVSKSVHGSLTSTRQVVSEFGKIDAAIGGMDRNLQTVIKLMSVSAPATRAFATNTTKLSIAGGDGHKYNVPNVVPGSKVMSVVLPMINTMQNGGPMAARKNSAEASNPLIGTLLGRQVPDGTNVNANVQVFDGFYGLPGQDWFVTHRVNGF